MLTDQKQFKNPPNNTEKILVAYTKKWLIKRVICGKI